MSNPKSYPLERSEEEWKNQLDEQSFRVLREKGTEYPFTGEYNDHFEKGIYSCKGCGKPLFRSKNKFDSSCGWPSYDEALPGAIEYIKDNSHGMLRTEILCAHCGGHQGHVFNDGPTATGLRYCVNSASIDFNPE
jgi:peptide-methionine (R)-S-oxide reductase